MNTRRLVGLGVALAMPSTLVAVQTVGQSVSPASAYVAAQDGEKGAPGIGDPYFPLDGNGGIDVRSYRIANKWDFDTSVLSGKTTVRLTTTQDLSSFNLDFLLKVKSVKVDGKSVRFDRSKGHELTVNLRKPAVTGTDLKVVVAYADKPSKYRYAGESNWLSNDTEVVAMNEPHMSPWWFPANDHPLDKASYRFDLTVAKGLQVVANGLPKGKRTSGRWTTYKWVAKDPMASYLAFFGAGRYDIVKGKTDGLPWVNAVSKDLTPREVKIAQKWLAKSPKIVSWLSAELGEYPFEASGGLVTGLDVGFALENQTRPTYPYVGGAYDSLLVHELAHQWFGDDVAVHNWADIWLNEGFASYMEARYVEANGGISTDQWLRDAYDQQRDAASWKVAPGDPGAKRIFDGAVYGRGAMALAALRNVIGDAAFNTTLRTWLEQKAGGNGQVEEFIAVAEQVSGKDLDSLFQAWLYAKTRPADTAANGLG